MRPLLICAALLLGNAMLFAQNTLRIQALDSTDHSPLVGATVRLKNQPIGAVTDQQGEARLHGIPNGAFHLEVSYGGYAPVVLAVTLPTSDTMLTVLLAAANLDEVIISTTRTNSRIEDLPVKVEVLGLEELDEEASLVPSGMGSLLGDLSVITIQRTNPVNGNDAVRMQGLDPGYTQLLQDGLPLYEGFSGSLGVLSIPPLDLKQVEIIKGSSSTLYGGGAIGGIINFIARTPAAQPKTTLVFNQTTLGETNFNGFTSRRFKGGDGFTLLASGTLKSPADINSDGFAEVPRTRSLLLHPRYFFHFGKKINADLGLTYSYAQLDAGDREAIRQKAASAEHPFFQSEDSRRATLNGQLAWQTSAATSLTLKSTASQYRRGGEYAGFLFTGSQISSYSEANFLWKTAKNTLVTGLNVITEDFRRKSGDAVPFGDYRYTTTGLFAQGDWQIAPKLSVEAGLRTDRHSRYGWFVLPRIGLFYKPSTALSVRVAYGTGYKTPDLFAAAEPTEYARLQPLSADIQANRADGLNMDINYHALLFEELSLQINQAFYYTGLEKPFATETDAAGNIFLKNADWRATSFGTDTYIQLTYKDLELYLGYNHTLSEQHQPGGDVNTPFNPRDKLAVTLAYEIGEKWRMGAESAYSANQYVEGNRQVPSFWFFAAMVARQFHWGSLVLNCENVGDSRQSRHEPLVTGGFLNPVFTPIWGPVEGRVVNLALKISI